MSYYEKQMQYYHNLWEKAVNDGLDDLAGKYMQDYLNYQELNEATT